MPLFQIILTIILLICHVRARDERKKLKDVAVRLSEGGEVHHSWTQGMEKKVQRGEFWKEVR